MSKGAPNISGICGGYSYLPCCAEDAAAHPVQYIAAFIAEENQHV